jgi:hypothetical protein
VALQCGGEAAAARFSGMGPSLVRARQVARKRNEGKKKE